MHVWYLHEIILKIIELSNLYEHSESHIAQHQPIIHWSIDSWWRVRGDEMLPFPSQPRSVGRSVIHSHSLPFFAWAAAIDGEWGRCKKYSSRISPATASKQELFSNTKNNPKTLKYIMMTSKLCLFFVYYIYWDLDLIECFRRSIEVSASFSIWWFMVPLIERL